MGAESTFEFSPFCDLPPPPPRQSADGGGFNYTGKKAEISNNPWLFLPAQTVFDAVVGYDWKTGNNKWSAKLTWKNFTDEDERQTVRERGQPSRIIADLTVRF